MSESSKNKLALTVKKVDTPDKLYMTYEYPAFCDDETFKNFKLALYVHMFVYNSILQSKVLMYLKDGVNLDRTGAKKLLKGMRESNSALEGYNVQSLEFEINKVNTAFKCFFNARKNNRYYGYPKIKTQKDFNTITYTQSGFKIIDKENNKKIIKFTDIGEFEFIDHYRLPKNTKIQNVRLTRKYGIIFINIVVIMDLKEPKRKKGVLGCDLGYNNNFTLSNGETINIFENWDKILEIINAIQELNKELKKIRSELAKIKTKKKAIKNELEERKRKLELEKKGLFYNLYCIKKGAVNNACMKILNMAHTLYLEDTNVSSILYKNRNEPILVTKFRLSALSEAKEILKHLFIKYQQTLYLVSPYFTSSVCHKCGSKLSKLDDDREHMYCPKCKKKMHRDVNAAKVILKIGNSDKTITSKIEKLIEITNKNNSKKE